MASACGGFDCGRGLDSVCRLAISRGQVAMLDQNGEGINTHRSGRPGYHCYQLYGRSLPDGSLSRADSRIGAAASVALDCLRRSKPAPQPRGWVDICGAAVPSRRRQTSRERMGLLFSARPSFRDSLLPSSFRWVALALWAKSARWARCDLRVQHQGGCTQLFCGLRRRGESPVAGRLAPAHRSRKIVGVVSTVAGASPVIQGWRRISTAERRCVAMQQ